MECRRRLYGGVASTGGVRRRPVITAKGQGVGIAGIGGMLLARGFPPHSGVNRRKEAVGIGDCRMDMRNQQGIGQRHGAVIKLATANDIKRVALRSGKGGRQVGADSRIGQSQRQIAADDEVLPPRQGAANAVISFAPHDDRMAEGMPLEMLQITRQVPRHLIVAANGAVVALRHDKDDFRHGGREGGKKGASYIKPCAA